MKKMESSNGSTFRQMPGESRARPSRTDHQSANRFIRIAWIGAVWLLALGGLAVAVHGQTTPVPPLDFEPIDENNVVVSWPDVAPGFILQESDSPAAAAVWRGVPQTPVASGGRLKVTRTIDSSTVRMFYRIRKKGGNPGIDYLVASQNGSGLWGDPARTQTRDSAAAVEALALYGQNNSAVGLGISGLYSQSTRNNDEAARKTVVLAGQGYDVSSLLTDLLASQGAAVQDSTALGYPGRGWGLASGFGNSTIDTALVLRALTAGARGAGLCSFRETVPAGSTTPPHAVSVPAGGNSFILRVRNVTGATLRFLLTPPGGGGDYYVDVNPRTTVVDIVGYPYLPGTWYLKAQNSSGSGASYIAEVGFNDASGFDSFRFTSALTYLALAQNADGGWGIAAGEDSHLMITAEVLRTLAACGNNFFGPQVLNAGAAWLLTRQNVDGGFSSEAGTSNGHETSLAVLAIRAANPSASLGTAVAYLKGAQLPDGSWANDPYQTALAAQALRAGPVVTTIPGQSVVAPAPFAPINLDNFVSDPIYPGDQLIWTVSGNTVLSVSIANRVATITYPPATTVSEQLTFTATDPDGLSGSSIATFSVVYQAADYTIARGGSATGSRNFSGAQAVLDQAAYYTETQHNMPAGVTYTTTGVSRISATEMKINFQISVGLAAATGVQQFQVEYGLLDASNNPLGPLSGNIFNFSILVTP